MSSEADAKAAAEAKAIEMAEAAFNTIQQQKEVDEYIRDNVNSPLFDPLVDVKKYRELSQDTYKSVEDRLEFRERYIKACIELNSKWNAHKDEIFLEVTRLHVEDKRINEQVKKFRLGDQSAKGTQGILKTPTEKTSKGKKHVTFVVDGQSVQSGGPDFPTLDEVAPVEKAGVAAIESPEKLIAKFKQIVGQDVVERSRATIPQSQEEESIITLHLKNSKDANLFRHLQSQFKALDTQQLTGMSVTSSSVELSEGALKRFVNHIESELPNMTKAMGDTPITLQNMAEAVARNAGQEPLSRSASAPDVQSKASAAVLAASKFVAATPASSRFGKVSNLITRLFTKGRDSKGKDSVIQQ